MEGIYNCFRYKYYIKFYRYSIDTRNDIFSMLSSISKRLWIPYWVVKEYLKIDIQLWQRMMLIMISLFLRSQKYWWLLEWNSFKKSDNLNCKKNLENILEKAKKDAVNILKNEKKSKKDGIDNPKNGNVIDKKY